MAGEITVAWNKLLSSIEDVDNARLNQLVSDLVATLDDDAVSSAKIAAAAVTPAKISDWSTGLDDYANDAAADSGGVAVGELYRNGSVIQVRVA